MATLFLIGSAAVAVPQERQRGNFDPAQMVDRQVTAMKDRLKLTDDQEKKVRTILTDSAKKSSDLRQKMEPGQPPSEETMAAMKKNREDTNKKLSEVLSKDQMTEYEKMMSEMRGRMGQGGGRKKQQ
jgi:hypothetical protein